MDNLQQWCPPISDAYGVFLLHCRAQRYSPKTIAFYDRRIPRFIDWLAAQGVTELTALTANHVRAYIVKKQDDGGSPHYVHGIARALHAWLAFCVTEGWLSVSPMRSVKMPKLPRQILPSLNEVELKRILKVAESPRDRAIVLTLLDTGLRAAELIALVGGDVSVSDGVLQVRGGKGAKDRTVYAGSKTIRAILRYYGTRGLPAPKDPIWLTERKPHPPLTYDGLAQLMRRIAAAASVPTLTAHALRRTYALSALRNGMNIYALQRLMGHEDIGVLRHYLALVETDLAAASRQHGVVDNLT